MIFWISVILTLAGPMLLSGVEKIYLDFMSIRRLQNGRFMSEEWIRIIVVLLCRNFDDYRNGSAWLKKKADDIRLRSSRSAQLGCYEGSTQSYHERSGQLRFCRWHRCPFFFLAGFLYNALGITDETTRGANWTP